MIKSNQKEKKYFIITKTKRLNYWTKEEDELLLKLTCKSSYVNWKQIGNHFENKNYIQCASRYWMIKPGIIHGHWKPEEDNVIIKLTNKYVQRWAKISNIMGNRTSKQVRDRYLYYLDKSINKDKYSQLEDNLIKKHFINHGPKWSLISSFLEGRTSASIKNRFNSKLKKGFIIEHIKTKVLKRMNQKKYFHLRISNYHHEIIDRASILSKLSVENTISFYIYGKCINQENKPQLDNAGDYILNNQLNFNEFIKSYISNFKNTYTTVGKEKK